MIVVRELLLGPKRFGDLQRDIVGIGPTVLTRRLHDLVADGLAQRRRAHGTGRAEVYELTPWGYGLEQVNTALASWAVDSPSLPWDADMSPDTLVLTMRAHARPLPAESEPVTVAMVITDSRRTPPTEPVHYRAELSAEATTLERGTDPAQATAVLTATTRALKTAVLALSGREPTANLVSAGDPTAVEHLLAATRLHP